MPGAAKPARSGPGTGMAWLAVSGVPTVRLPDPIDAFELSRTTILSCFVECQCQIPDLCRRDHLDHDRSWGCAFASPQRCAYTGPTPVVVEWLISCR